MGKPIGPRRIRLAAAPSGQTRRRGLFGVRPLTALRRALAPLGEKAGLVAAAPPVPIREIIRRFWPDLRADRWLLLLGLAAVAALPAVMTIEVWLFQILVDSVLVPQVLGPLGWLALAYLALNLCSGGLSYTDEYVAARVGGKFLVRLRSRLFAHVHQLSLPTLDRRHLGDLVARLSGDVAAIESLFVSGLTRVVSAVFQLMFFVGALLLLDWQLALASLVLAPLFWSTARFFAQRLKRASREKRRRTGSLSSIAEESLSSAALVQSHGLQAQEAARFQAEAQDIYVAEIAAAKLRGLYPIVVHLFELAGMLAAIVLGAWALAEGRLTLGGLLAFLAYLGMLYRPVQELGDVVGLVFAASAGAERVLELLDTPAGVTERPGARSLHRIRGRLDLESVTYRYPDAAVPTLQDAHLRIHPGEVVALLGPSGVGKSTVARLLARLIDPDEGAVRLDGHDVRDLQLTSVRASIGVVLQETLVFDASVRDNLLLGQPAATDAELSWALEEVDALDFVTAMPGGLAARIGQKGRSLSGGQRQRIALARTLLRDSPVLVLDEPTNGLDSTTAARVLPRLLADRTAVLITHDPEVAAMAHRTLLIDGGQIHRAAACETTDVAVATKAAS
ncbi:MAG: ABC transporter ATP-binding protein/permease [Actinomycetota bacterium]|nr:ABC transporter ATP-binding protein/permease [Actinomycetota bacterium]